MCRTKHPSRGFPQWWYETASFGHRQPLLVTRCFSALSSGLLGGGCLLPNWLIKQVSGNGSVRKNHRARLPHGFRRALPSSTKSSALCLIIDHRSRAIRSLISQTIYLWGGCFRSATSVSTSYGSCTHKACQLLNHQSSAGLWIGREIER